MPPVRCKWYDDDGYPYRDGCRSEQSGCTYVHPTHPDWNIAIRRSLATKEPPTTRGRGRGRGFSAPSSRDSGWAGAGRKPSNSSNSEWDTDAWKPKAFNNPPPTSAPSSVATSSRDPEPSTSKAAEQWGSSNSWGSSNDWGNSNNNNTADATKEVKSLGGWGSTSAWETTTADTWGSGSWGGGWGDSGNNDTNTTTDPVDPTPIVPPTTQTSRPEALSVDVNKIPVEPAIPPPQSASSYRAASMAPSEQTVLATPQSAFPSFTVPRPTQSMTRSEIHFGIIKNTVRATRIRLELKELQKELEIWKATQLSPQFHRVSVPAGERLDGIRKNLTTQITGVKTRLKHAEDELVRLPELPSAVPHLVDLDREMLAYTEQLRSWLQSFIELAVQPKLPASTEPDAMDMDEASAKPSGPVSLLADLEERIAQVEESLNEVQAEIPSPHSVPKNNAAYIEDAISARLRGEETGDQAAERKSSVATVKADADAGKKKVASLAEQIALLQIRNEAREKHLVNLEEQRDQNGRLLQTMQTQLILFQQSKEARSKQRALLAEQFARFAANPRRIPLVLNDSVLAGVRATVEAMIQDEVVPALKNIGTRYAAAVECRMTSLEQAIQPAVDQTNEICRRAEAMEIQI